MPSVAVCPAKLHQPQRQLCRSVFENSKSRFFEVSNFMIHRTGCFWLTHSTLANTAFVAVQLICLLLCNSFVYIISCVNAGQSGPPHCARIWRSPKMQLYLHFTAFISVDRLAERSQQFCVLCHFYVQFCLLPESVCVDVVWLAGALYNLFSEFLMDCGFVLLFSDHFILLLFQKIPSILLAVLFLKKSDFSK